MKKWGLGIEHEMRIRFKHPISELSSNIKEKYFNNYHNEYIFIDSELLLYYFNMHEVPLMKNIEQKDDDIEYFNTISNKNNLYQFAKNKRPFPLEDETYFNISSEKSKKESIVYLDYYLMIYRLYHAPLLFFNFTYNYEINMNIKDFIKYNKIIELIYNETDKYKIIEFIESELINIYNQSHENNAFEYLKKLFQKREIGHYMVKYNSITNEVYIILFYKDENNKNNKNNKNKVNKNNKTITIKSFIEDLIKYITNIKSIFESEFNNNNINKKTYYKNLYILYKNNIPHIDHTYRTLAIEMKTINYENMNYEKTLNDLIDLEKTFFFTINNLNIFKDLTNNLGEFIYHNIGSIKDTISVYDIINLKYEMIEEDYTGSYHIWITLPYSAKTKMNQFINNHVSLANKLQLLEPIICAHFSSPSYDALNDNQSKSSLRQFLNFYSNYGTSDITLMYGTKKHQTFDYYLSENDIINEKNLVSYVQYPIYDNNEKLIINYGKLNTRAITNNLFYLINKGDEESSTNVNVYNYYSQIFEKTKIRPKQRNYINLGADIRTRDLNDYFYPLNEDWEKVLLLRKNKLIEVYYNKKLNKISYERVYNKEKHKKDLLNKIGIEFRILDHFPTHYLNQILGLLVPIVLDSCKSKEKIKFKNTHIAQQFWHDEMVNVIEKGYEYTLGLKYIHALEKEFNIEIKDKVSLNTEKIMEILYEKLSEKYKKTYKKSLYYQMKFNTKIIFINFNKKAWFEIIKKYFNNNPHVYRKILYYNKNINNKNIVELLGEKYQYNIKKIKNYFLQLE